MDLATLVAGRRVPGRPQNGHEAVVAADRKTVAQAELFANPYVRARPRSADAETLYALLKRARWSAFSALAARYGVRYVIVPATRRVALGRARSAPLTRVFSAADRKRGSDVYRLVPPSGPRASK